MSRAPRFALAIVAVVLAVAGMAVAGYLAVVNTQGDTGVCVGVHGCAEVQDSKYGKLFGVPVSVPGLFAYTLLAVVAVAWFANFRGRTAELALVGFLAAFGGLLFSGYLTYIEGWVLEAWCSYCIVSALLMTGLFLAWSAMLALTLREAAQDAKA